MSPTLQSDVTVSSSDCDSESDQQPIRSEKPSKKRRQRTTFSAQEVWAMERAYKRCRYLTIEDEADLVKRFRIPVRSIKVSERSITKARFKRRTLHVPILMQMSENNRFFSFALDSAHVQFDV